MEKNIELDTATFNALLRLAPLQGDDGESKWNYLKVSTTIFLIKGFQLLYNIYFAITSLTIFECELNSL